MKMCEADDTPDYSGMISKWEAAFGPLSAESTRAAILETTEALENSPADPPTDEELESKTLIQMFVDVDPDVDRILAAAKDEVLAHLRNRRPFFHMTPAQWEKATAHLVVRLESKSPFPKPKISPIEPLAEQDEAT